MDECVACGLCVKLCPVVFAQDENKPVVATLQVAPDDGPVPRRPSTPTRLAASIGGSRAGHAPSGGDSH
ncbi:hypothetical protein DFAR_1860026 [Desulfarculales bacterium]